uniref:Putative salivary secreted protein n=1 Tax=Ixodes ricinus TaxID=34613 RepID=A0A147BV20_IXORI
MLQRIVLTVLLVQAVINGMFLTGSFWNQLKCMQLIREGGSIACRITGEGNYDRMSLQNCWLSCNNGSNTFLLPHETCERVLDVSWWQAHQTLTGKLPPFGYEDCDEKLKRRLESWVENWRSYEKAAEETLCQ